MKNSRNIINIEDLPEFAKTELRDFYEFLKAKHKISSKDFNETNGFPLSRFISKAIKVDKIIKFSRDEIHYATPLPISIL